MNKRKLTILVLLGIVIISGIIFGVTKMISSLDVVGIQSLSSFKIITEELNDNISLDEEKNSWKLVAPDNSVAFYLSKNFIESSLYDAMLEFDTEPFINAGLDVDKLPSNYIIGETIIVGVKLGDEQITYDGDLTPYTTYEKIVKLKRERIKYHAALDHYGIDIGGGNAFEWAKDIITNDKDIVFVLNPEPFISAGVDPEKIDGWLYNKIPTMKDGKKVEVYKFLKVFNLK